MKGQIGNMMQQVQRMQQDMQRAQEELANIEVVGQAGGGAVKVTMTARMDVRRVQIDPAMAGDDIEMLEDLIAAAMNDAVNKAKPTGAKGTYVKKISLSSTMGRFHSDDRWERSMEKRTKSPLTSSLSSTTWNQARRSAASTLRSRTTMCEGGVPSSWASCP